MRSLCLIAFGCLGGLLIYTYDLKIATRALEAHSAELASQVQDESDFLTLMRAETTYLTRPDRIAEIAKTKLGFEPLSSSQLVPWSAIASTPVAEWQPKIADADKKEGIASLIERSTTRVPTPSQR